VTVCFKTNNLVNSVSARIHFYMNSNTIMFLDNVILEEVPESSALWFCNGDGFDAGPMMSGSVTAYSYIPNAIYNAYPNFKLITASYDDGGTYGKLIASNVFGFTDLTDAITWTTSGNATDNGYYDAQLLKKTITVAGDRQMAFLWGDISDLASLKPLAPAAGFTVSSN